MKKRRPLTYRPHHSHKTTTTVLTSTHFSSVCALISFLHKHTKKTKENAILLELRAELSALERLLRERVGAVLRKQLHLLAAAKTRAFVHN